MHKEESITVYLSGKKARDYIQNGGKPSKPPKTSKPTPKKGKRK